MIKSKKLSSLVAASLILAGGSFLGVQTVSATDDTSLKAVQALALQNRDFINELTEKVNNISTTPEQLQQIHTNKADIATNKGNIAANKTDIAANTDAIHKEVQDRTNAVADEAAARGDKDKEHDTAIAANTKAIADEATDRDKADQQEASERKAEDSQLNTKMTNGFAAIQGQQDAQDAKIDKNHTDIQTNAGNIQKNGDAIKANSDRLDDHEGRIAGNETNIATNATNISKEISDRQDADTALQKNIDKEASERKAEDSQLNTKMTNGFAAIQGQQDAQDAKIDKNHTDIQTNAGNIKKNTDAIQANSDKIADHEDRISSNAKNIEAIANTIHKVQGDVVDNKNAISAEAAARSDKDKEHDTAIAANKTDIAQIQKDLEASNLKDMSDTAASLKNYANDMKVVEALATGNQKNIATNKDNIAANKTAIADEAAARDKADQKEASERKAEDSQLNTKMTNGFAAIQGQQDVQDAKIDKNHTDIQTNAGKIQNNQDAIKANSDKLTNHEDRITTNESNIERNAESIKKETNARIDADQQEAQTRAAEDTRLDTKMDKGFATIQGQQDEQDAKIGKNQKDIQTNAGKIQNNQDAIKANSDKLTNHEDRISSNAKNIEANANTLHKVQGDVVDNKNAISAEAAARGDKDKEHDTAIAANKKAIGDEAAARQADISRLDNKIHDVSKEVDTVGALSMAMSGLHPLSYDEGDARFQLSAAVGTYDGTEALALGGFYHFNRDSMLSVGVATDLGADEHRMGANVGYTRRIGQGGHVSRPSEGTVSDIMKDIKNLEQKQAKLEQENEQLKQQLAALKK